MNKDHLAGTGTMFAFVLGVTAGALVALLFAPQSGEELRGDIAKGARDGAKQARSVGNDLKKRGQKVVDLTHDRLQDAIETAYRQVKRA